MQCINTVATCIWSCEAFVIVSMSLVINILKEIQKSANDITHTIVRRTFQKTEDLVGDVIYTSLTMSGTCVMNFRPCTSN